MLFLAGRDKPANDLFCVYKLVWGQTSTAGSFQRRPIYQRNWDGISGMFHSVTSSIRVSHGLNYWLVIIKGGNSMTKLSERFAGLGYVRKQV